MSAASGIRDPYSEPSLADVISQRLLNSENIFMVAALRPIYDCSKGTKVSLTVKSFL